MKQKLFALMLSLSAMAMTVFTSCDKDEPEQFKPASVEIKIESTSSTGISFTLTPSDAEQAFYKCVKSSEPESGTYTETNGKEASTIQIDNLEENTEYTISAYAVNAAGENSETVSETAVTTSLASVKIKVTSVTDSSITFTLTPVNAVNCHYAVTDPAQAETAELTNETGSGKEGEYTIAGLEAGKRYTIAATATNASGEISARSYASSLTEETPYIEITSIETDGTSAKITIESTGCETMYYCMKNEGESASESDFKELKYSTLYLYELEKDHNYSIYLYGKNRNGYKGKTVTQNFSAIEGEDKGYKVTISEITSFDASVNISWNEESYKGAYWIVDSPKNLATPEKFDWQESIANYTARPVYSQGISKLSYFTIQPGEMYRMGIIFTDKDGNPDLSTATWKDIQLDEINFGEAACSVEIEKISVAYSTLVYKIKNSGASAYYLGYKAKASIEDVTSYAKEIIKGTSKNTFDTEIKLQYLSQSTDYLLLVIPVDENGKYGKISELEFSTEDIVSKGNSQMEVVNSENEYTKLSFEVNFGENTEKVYYVSFSDDSFGFDSDEAIMKKLAYSNNFITESKTVTISYLTSNTEYNIWFASANKYGEIGSIQKFKTKTKAVEFNGTGTVSVQINEITQDNNRFKTKFTMTPDQNISKYYYRTGNVFLLDALSDEQFVEQFHNGYTAMEGTYTDSGKDGSGVYVDKNAYIIILPIDKNGNLCPLVKYFIEETSSN